MPRYLILYRAPTSARQQMTSSTPEQRKAGMELWRAWSSKAGASIVDLGAPLGEGVPVGAREAYNDIAGYSILDADSEQGLVDLLRDPLPYSWRANRSASDAAPPGM